MKKLLGWVALGFVIFYISTNPARAADTVNALGSGLGDIATNIGIFVQQLATGT